MKDLEERLLVLRVKLLALFEILKFVLLMILLGLAILLRPFIGPIVNKINKKLYGKSGIYGAKYLQKDLVLAKSELEKMEEK